MKWTKLKSVKANEDFYNDTDSFEYLYSLLVNGNITLYKQKLQSMDSADTLAYIKWLEEMGISTKEAFPFSKFGEKTADEEQEGLTFEQLSPEAKKKATEAISEYNYESQQGMFKDFFDDLLQNKYKEYELDSDILDIDEDSYGRINVSLKSNKKIWPAFSNILVPIARKEFEKVIGNSDYFKNEETLMDWVKEATSDLYYENHYDWFVPYATLNDVEGIDGWKLSNDIAEAANDEGREQIEKVLEQLSYDLTKDMEYPYYTEEEARQYAMDYDFRFNEDGSIIY